MTREAMRAGPNLVIRLVQPTDQHAARRLIVDGLGEHFGFVHESINVDLEDIMATYAAATFLVAELAGDLVGTGALIDESEGVGRIVRMSVRKDRRRSGVATALIERLLAEARTRGWREVVIETGFWEDSMDLYRSCGFRETGRDGDGLQMALEL